MLKTTFSDRDIRNLNIITQWQFGYTVPQVAKDYGLSEGAVYNIIREWRYNARTGKRPVDKKRGDGFVKLVKQVRHPVLATADYFVIEEWVAEK